MLTLYEIKRANSTFFPKQKPIIAKFRTGFSQTALIFWGAKIDTHQNELLFIFSFGALFLIYAGLSNGRRAGFVFNALT